MVETWTLENQIQVSPNLFVSLGYLGMHSTHLHGLIDYPNDMPLSGLALGSNLFNVAVRIATSLCQLPDYLGRAKAIYRRPFVPSRSMGTSIRTATCKTSGKPVTTR